MYLTVIFQVGLKTACCRNGSCTKMKHRQKICSYLLKVTEMMAPHMSTINALMNRAYLSSVLESTNSHGSTFFSCLPAMGVHPLSLECHGWKSLKIGWRKALPEGVNCRFEALVTWQLVPVDDSTWKKEYFRRLVREESGMKVVSSEFLVQRDGFWRWLVESAIWLFTAL